MAHLYRLIVFAVCVVLAFPARAGTIETVAATSQPDAPTLKWEIGDGTLGQRVYNTPEEACQWYIQAAYGWQYSYLVVQDATHRGCYVTDPPAPLAKVWGATSQVSSCVPNGSAPTAQCSSSLSCPSGYWGPDGGGMCSREQCADGTWKQPGTCPPVNNCAELAQFKTPAGEYSGPGGIGTYRLCDTAGVSSSGDPSQPGCVVVIDAWFSWGSPPAQGWSGGGKFTGEKCMPDPLASPSGTGTNVPPPSPTTGETAACPPGKVPGTVNGVRVCVDPGTADPISKRTSSTTSTPNPDGTTTQRETVTTTECGAAGCNNTTVTTTTVIPAGGGTGTSTSETSTGSCTRGTAGCSPDGGDDDPSRFGGACGSPFVCSGDAIMCAVALEQHRRNCALFVDSSPESALYDAEKGKTGVQYVSETVTVGPGSFSQSSAIGGTAQCISDKTVTVWNQQVVLPFSQVCASLQYLGTVLIFVSFILAYRIVSRG